jgi:D-glycero-D-manno-heptose 1,7-bisphosphate phosphatase
MIEDLVSAWPVNLPKSLFVGDSEADMRAAQAAGVTGIRYEGGSLLKLVHRYIG